MEGYNYTKDYNHLEYHFSTLNGIFYSVKFSPDETFNSISNSENFNNVFQVILAKTTKEKEPFDYNVSATVRNIIVDFLQNNLNSKLYLKNLADFIAIISPDLAYLPKNQKFPLFHFFVDCYC